MDSPAADLSQKLSREAEAVCRQYLYNGRKHGHYWVVGDVDHCVRELTAFVMEFGITDLVTWAVPPGMTTDQMNPHLEKFVKEVAPRLKAAVG